MSGDRYYSVVGTSAHRVEGIEKVTGQAKFTGDLIIPGMLECKVLRSPYPHALIESIDVNQAEALPGVVAVLTREDIQDFDPYYGHCLRDRPLIALKRVRYVGEPVAAVAADNGATAEEVRLLHIFVEEPVLSPAHGLFLHRGGTSLKSKSIGY